MMGLTVYGFEICVGNVVVVHDENIRRFQWKLGRVVGLITRKDDALRGAVVRKLTDKKETCTEIRSRRPIQKLYPVELSDEIKDEKGNYIRRVNKRKTIGQREKRCGEKGAREAERVD